MIQDGTLMRMVQDIRYAGESPLLQYDILDSRTLLRHVQVFHPHTNPRTLGKVLRALEMHPIGMHSVAGQVCMLWTCLPFQPEAGIVSIAKTRVRGNLTGLGMETSTPPAPGYVGPIERLPRLTAFERDVLSMRMRRQGLRFPRPKEIAAALGGSPMQVNFALQKIRRVLGLQSLKDARVFREAVRASGVLLEDPAFS